MFCVFNFFFSIRQVVHDVAEIAGLIAHSFGEEGVDRHVELWKKGSQSKTYFFLSSSSKKTLLVDKMKQTVLCKETLK